MDMKDDIKNTFLFVVISDGIVSILRFGHADNIGVTDLKMHFGNAPLKRTFFT